MDYPPLKPKQLANLKREIQLIPYRHREDALQEAWLAYLEGKNPIMAVKGYWNRERRHERREAPFSQVKSEQIEEVKSVVGSLPKDLDRDN